MTVKKASAVWKGSVKDGEGGMSGVEADEAKITMNARLES